MSSTNNILSLPNELIASVATHLSPHGLVQLAKTCKQMNVIVEPLLWADVEFHTSGYHESAVELNDPPPFLPPSQRRCIENKCNSSIVSKNKSEDFFTLLQYYQAHDENRLMQLASRVRILCSVIVPYWRYERYLNREERSEYAQVWTVLPYFINLEALELYGPGIEYAYDEEDDPDTLSPTISNLRFAKLSGYIPHAVASWVISSGTKLERLELAMLDRQISSNLCDPPDFAPLPEERTNGDFSDAESDYGSLYGDAIIPRPLGGFLDNHNSTKLSMPRLRHLYLGQPSKGSYVHDYPEYSWSSRAAKNALEDWRTILLASGKTLETLVLEQRVGAEETEADGLGEGEFIQQFVGGAGSQDLVNCLERLLTDGKLSALAQVYLYGIAVGESVGGTPSNDVPGGHFMLLLKERNITCEARLGKWCSFESSSGHADWSRWFGHDEDYDDGASVKWDTVLASV